MGNLRRDTAAQWRGKRALNKAVIFIQILIRSFYTFKRKTRQIHTSIATGAFSRLDAVAIHIQMRLIMLCKHLIKHFTHMS